MPAVVEIEYCGPCGYTPRYEELCNKLKQAVPDAVICGCPDGRKASFEIEINGNLVFSRLMSNTFPDPDEIVAHVLQACE